MQSNQSVSSPVLDKNQSDLKVSTFGQSLSALVFGALIIFAVGFLPMEAAHNAAHDTRHAMAFPCH